MLRSSRVSLKKGENVKKVAFLLVITLFLSIAAFAEDKEEKYPTFDFSGLMYAHYVVDLSDGADYNAFDVTRGYLNFKASISDKIKVRITPDFKRTSEKTVTAIMKWAYVDFIDPVGAGFNIRLGLAPTAWEGYWTKWWGYRWIGRTPSGTHKLTTSSDFGVSILGKMLNKAVEYQLTVRNGEGYTGEAEFDSAKVFEGTINIQPVKSFPLHFVGHGKVSQKMADVDSRNNLYAGAVHFKNDNLQLEAEYNLNELEDVTRTVISFNCALKFDDITLLGRYDIFDPDDSIDDNNKNLLIAGLGYKFHKNVQAMLDVQYASYDADIDDDIMLYFHFEFKF